MTGPSLLARIAEAQAELARVQASIRESIENFDLESARGQTILADRIKSRIARLKRQAGE